MHPNIDLWTLTLLTYIILLLFSNEANHFLTGHMGSTYKSVIL